MKSLAAGLLAGGLLTVLTAGGGQAQDAAPTDPAFATTCTQCHAQEMVTAQRRTPQEWDDILNRMAGYGAMMTEQQRDEITVYLTTNFGPKAETAKP